MLRHLKANGKRHKANHECVAVISIVMFGKGQPSIEELNCELDDDDRTNGTVTKIVKVKGLSAKWARKNGVKSGITTILPTYSEIDGGSNELIVASGSSIEVSHTFLVIQNIRQ